MSLKARSAMSALSLQSTLTLASGVYVHILAAVRFRNSMDQSCAGNKIPQLGFGVAYGFGKVEDPAQLTKPSLTEALKVGYRCAY